VQRVQLDARGAVPGEVAAISTKTPTPRRTNNAQVSAELPSSSTPALPSEPADAESCSRSS